MRRGAAHHEKMCVYGLRDVQRVGAIQCTRTGWRLQSFFPDSSDTFSAAGYTLKSFRLHQKYRESTVDKNELCGKLCFLFDKSAKVRWSDATSCKSLSLKSRFLYPLGYSKFFIKKCAQSVPGHALCALFCIGSVGGTVKQLLLVPYERSKGM